MNSIATPYSCAIHQRTDESDDDDQRCEDSGYNGAEQRAIQQVRATTQTRDIRLEIGTSAVAFTNAMKELRSIDHTIDPGDQHRDERGDRARHERRRGDIADDTLSCSIDGVAGINWITVSISSRCSGFLSCRERDEWRNLEPNECGPLAYGGPRSAISRAR
jgi:hypothetical protein